MPQLLIYSQNRFSAITNPGQSDHIFHQTVPAHNDTYYD